MPEPTFDQHLRLARDPATPGTLLEEIAAKYKGPGHVLIRNDADSRQIWEALAANPGLPPHLLARLAPRLPAAFCANPAAPLLPLEAPEFVAWVDQENDSRRGYLVSDLLRRPDVPASLVAAFTKQSRDRALREEAALHIALKGEAPEGDGWLEEVRRVLGKQARALRGGPRQHLIDLVEAGIAPAWLSVSEDLTALQFVLPTKGEWGKPPRNPAAADPQASPEKLLALSRQRQRGNDMALIQNPTTPADALVAILERWWDKTPGRAVTALRTDLTPAIVEKLIALRDPVIHRMLRRRGYGSGDDTLSPHLRHEAALAASPRLRGKMARNTHALNSISPALCFFTLANLPLEFDTADGRKEIKTVQHLELAMNERCWQVRLAVPFHPRLTELLPDASTVLATLAEDGNRLVRAAARARLRGEDMTL